MSTGLGSPVKVKSYKFTIPFVGELEWEPDESQEGAAWELYVELVTRIAVQELDLDLGSAREALNSLYSLFATTREILRRRGPGVGAARTTVGGIAIAVLNKGIRPFLSKWHPVLQAHEASRPSSVAVQDWERRWEGEPQLRGELGQIRKQLVEYARALAEMAGVTPP